MLIIQIQEEINEEAKQFGDILQVGIFTESDISLKTLNSANEFWDMFQSSFLAILFWEQFSCQGSFEEDYYALAYKSMSAFHWSRHFCHQVNQFSG